MRSDFVGRRQELVLLNNLWTASKATFLILYGRRRVGKTRLLTHWLKRYSDHGLYWVAEPTSAYDQLRSFSQALYNFDTPDSPAPQDYTFANWEQAFRQVAKLAETRRMGLVIDEVTYLLDVNPALMGTMQKAWDQWMSNSNLMLALSGSQMGVMQKEMLAYDAPLYGRTTAQLQLPPLPFGVTGRFFPNHTAAERVALYAILGGIPAYWERLDPELSVMENLRLQLSPSNMWMLDEPRFLLQDFINDPHNYVSILRAIAHGSLASGQIAKRAGLSKGHVASYMSTLRDTGFVTRTVPVTEDASHSRRGRYAITDPYLRFYYYALAAYQSKLALGEQQQLLANIDEKLPAFIEANTWRELCAEWVLRASAHDLLPVPVEEVGSIWRGSLEVDVAGIDPFNRSLVVGTCQWQNETGDVDEIQRLARRVKKLLPDKNEWTIHFLGFARSGWDSEALAAAEQAIAAEADGQTWTAAGVRLLDLEQLDADLADWSG